MSKHTDNLALDDSIAAKFATMCAELGADGAFYEVIVRKSGGQSTTINSFDSHLRYRVNCVGAYLDLSGDYSLDEFKDKLNSYRLDFAKDIKYIVRLNRHYWKCKRCDQWGRPEDNLRAFAPNYEDCPICQNCLARFDSIYSDIEFDLFRKTVFRLSRAENAVPLVIGSIEILE